jgi:uncharacterized membrane protein YphA (DoxX/SURF4 family)/rhodanese-related sulfurtransferase
MLKYTVIILRLLLGLLFIISGMFKFIDLGTFYDTINMFNIVSAKIAYFIAIFVPSIEFVCGIFIILGVFIQFSFIILSFFMAVFIYSISINLFKGRLFSCNCFGPFMLSDTITWYSVLFDAVLLMLLIFIFIYFLKKEKSLFIHKEISFINQFTVFTFAILFIGILSNNLLECSRFNTNITMNLLKEIDWNEVYEKVNTKNAVLFDGRTIGRYKRYHAKQALPLPFGEFDIYFTKYDTLTKNTPLLVYCDNQLCGISKKVAKKLLAKGFQDISIVKGGIEALLLGNKK